MSGPGALDLFGTQEPPPFRRLLRAGRLSAILEEGNLRDIHFDDVEVLRAINYLARDSAWGTYAATIADLVIKETAQQFDVTYSARCDGPEGRFDYEMTLTGRADGSITMDANGHAVTDFPTNRTGFVLLHPAEVAGLDLIIETAQGAGIVSCFPGMIDPNVPATGIRAMTHRPAPGLSVRVAMTGDLFEMEDQRNWADASFKTYIRPLSKPRPYVIAKGAADVQSVILTVSGGRIGSAARVSPEDATQLAIGPAIGVMPAMALFADRAEALKGDLAHLPVALAQYLILRWQPGDPVDDLVRGRKLALAIQAVPVIEAILPAKDPMTEARAVMDALRLADLVPPVLLLAPHREFKTSPPGSLPPGEVQVDALVAAVREVGFQGRIIAGTPSFFPEFNRNPPGPLADAIYFGGCGIVHAADDLSVMETTSVYPAILATAAHRGGARPIWLGPCTLGARHAPYGATVAPNPDNRRIPMVRDDPRHKALFGAAYAVGLAAACGDPAVECLTFAAPFGPFGMVGSVAQRYPLCAVQTVLARAAGQVRRRIVCFALAAVAWEEGDLIRALMANITETDVALDLPANASLRLLGPDAHWAAEQRGKVTVGPYRTAIVSYLSTRDL